MAIGLTELLVFGLIFLIMIALIIAIIKAIFKPSKKTIQKKEDTILKKEKTKPIKKEIKQGAKYEAIESETKKSKKWLSNPVTILIIIAMLIFLIFALPIFPKYERQSYQEVVNQDDCNDISGCVCTKRGGFLWLTCVQCSCTRYRTITRYVPLAQLFD